MSDRNEIIALIPSLLSAHECVIIPGLGGFILLNSPAKIHPLNHKFEPPSTRLGFNSHLRLNDGLLAGALSSRYGLSHQKALEKVQEFAWACISELNEGKEVVFNEIGRIWFDEEKNFHFSPTPSRLLQDDSFGLSSFVAPPVKHRQAVSRKPHRDKRSSGILKKTARAFKYSLLVLPVLFLLVWSTTQTGMMESITAGYFKLGPLMYSGNDLPAHSPQLYSFDSLMFPDKFHDDIAIPDIHSTQPTAVDSILISNESVDNTVSVPDILPVSPKALAVADEVVAPLIKNKYCIIGGCFAEKAKAEDFLNNLISLGYPAFVAGYTASGLTRIAVQGFSSKDDASLAIQEMKEKIGSDVWIHKL